MAMGHINKITSYKDMQEQQAIPQTNTKEETTINKHTNEILQMKFITLMLYLCCKLCN
jgi:hypothetical protein